MAQRRSRNNAKKRRRTASHANHRSAHQGRHGPIKPLSPDLERRLIEADRLRLALRIPQAISLYEQVLSQAPDTPPALMGLAQCLVRRNQIDQGLQRAQRACTLARQHPAYVALFAELLLASGRIDEADQAARKVLAKSHDHLGALLTLAQALEKKHEYESALDTVIRALSIAKDNDYALLLHGRLLRRLHRFAEAGQLFSDVLTHDALRPDLRQLAVHESAMTLDQLGRYDEAYSAFVQYGDIVGAGPLAERIDRGAWPREIAAYRKTVSGDFLDSSPTHLPINDALADPVFLVGFPRSGTTMTEQILAAHPCIITTDEKPFLNAVKSHMIREAGIRKPVAELLTTLTPPLLTRLRQIYWEAVRQKVGPIERGRVFIDKLPLNIIDLPLINILFPNAKVIVALRDPRDVCLSCFMQDFGLNEAMIHFLTLDSTAIFYASVMSLYMEMKNVVNLSMVEVRYEDTVNDLKSTAEELLNFLGLDWDDRVMRFHEIAQSRTISTPSFAAVTEPIHQRAVSRWKHYVKPFAEVRSILTPFVDAFGYD